MSNRPAAFAQPSSPQAVRESHVIRWGRRIRPRTTLTHASIKDSRPPSEVVKDSRPLFPAVVAVAFLALLASAQLPVSPWYAAQAGGMFAAIVLIATSGLRNYHPFPTFGPANHVTMARAALVALIAGFIGEPDLPIIAWSAVLIAIPAVVLDGVDGSLARRSRMMSAFGARFDMEIDALLVQLLAILAWQHGKAGPWVLLSGFMRYLFVAAGWLWPWMRRHLFPSFRRKAICVAQIVGLIVTIMPVITPPASAAVAGIALAALFYSFFCDSFWLWRHRC